ncbi:hypothetical protein QFC22_004498 [Naganishia vaughanmartiniae]|uniref:Uncharacterized protein n=1 Tax=Naganishia vaughanmartiniae TaxID=1424756 RepID=A0ACC2X4G7_9TREE|nr:hypothetical protein QFC22_004498 [Naganishia vaughanmartiniae]
MAYQILEAKATASANEIEQHRATLEACAASHAEALVVDEQRLAAAELENTSLVQECETNASLVFEKDQTIARLTHSVKQRDAKILIFQSQKKTASRAHEALALKNEYLEIQLTGLRNAKTEAEAKAIESETRAIAAEAKLVEEEDKAVDIADRLVAAEVTVTDAAAEAFAAQTKADAAIQASIHAQVEAVQAEARGAQAEAKVVILRRKVISAEKEHLNANARIEGLSQGLKRFHADRETLGKDLDALEHDHATLKGEYVTLEADYTVLEAETIKLAQQMETIVRGNNTANETPGLDFEGTTHLLRQFQKCVYLLSQGESDACLHLLLEAVDECKAWLATSALQSECDDKVGCERVTDLFLELRENLHLLWEGEPDAFLRLMPAAVEGCRAWFATECSHLEVAKSHNLEPAVIPACEEGNNDEVDTSGQPTHASPRNALALPTGHANASATLDAGIDADKRVSERRTYDQVRYYHEQILDLMDIAPNAGYSQEVVDCRFEVHRVLGVIEMWLDEMDYKRTSNIDVPVVNVAEPIDASESERDIKSSDYLDVSPAVGDDVRIAEPSSKIVSWQSVEMELFGYVTFVSGPAYDNAVTPSTWVVDTPAVPEQSVEKDEEKCLLMTPPLTQAGSDLGSDDDFFETCDLAGDVDEINWTVPDSPASEIWAPSQGDWIPVSDSKREWIEQQVDGLTPSPTCEVVVDPYKKDLYACVREAIYEEEGMF